MKISEKNLSFEAKFQENICKNLEKFANFKNFWPF